MRKSYQGAHSLEGNQSSEFLKKVDKLEHDLLQESDLVKLAGLPYIEVLRAFRAVQEACFGLDLKPDYKDKIDKFSKCYRNLDISVTPKVFLKYLKPGPLIFLIEVHIIENHISDFYDKTGEKVGKFFLLNWTLKNCFRLGILLRTGI